MATLGCTPKPILYFQGIVFHELLHTYVNSILGWSGSTPLLTKYANEPDGVRRHLHLDAIQKLVYQKLGRAADLAAIVESDGANFGPDYRRAWQIVNDLEDARAFAAELR